MNTFGILGVVLVAIAFAVWGAYKFWTMFCRDKIDPDETDSGGFDFNTETTDA